MAESTEFNAAKSTLLKYYSDLQNSLGVRLFAFSVLLFTLFQITSWNSSQGLSAIWDGTFSISSLFKITLFLLAIFVIISYMVRTIFRYASLSGICNWIIVIEPFSNGTKSIQAAICAEIYQRMVCRETHVFVRFPFQWFVSGTLGDDEELNRKWNNVSNFYGWSVSLIIGIFLLTCFLLVYSNILFS
jgi:hypothetical protein